MSKRRAALPKPWHGIRLHQGEAAADPDSPPVSVILPAGWGAEAAPALAAICAPAPRANLIEAASAWIGRIGDPVLRDRMHEMLRARRGAPSLAIWRGEAEAEPSFVLNLPEFLEGDAFNIEAFAGAIDDAVAALTLLAPEAFRLVIGMADLALLLARLDLDYGSGCARDTAAMLAAFLTARADLASASLSGKEGYRISVYAPLPEACAIPGLAEATAVARRVALKQERRRHQGLTGIPPAGPVEALLGIETIGIAAPLAPLDGAGHLAHWASARLAVRGVNPESAVAAVIAGDDPFDTPVPAASRAMHDAVAPHLHLTPARPAMLACRQPAKPREALPDRRSGYTQKAIIGGHRLFLRTGEFPDGRLGEIAITLHRESAGFRGLMDAFATAVSLGLQHGVPLEELIESFTFTRFGPGGVVEGDPAVAYATSLVDYVFRHLAANYCADYELAPAMPESEDGVVIADPEPLLPLELPKPGLRHPRRPVLKLVG
ncbi:MAG TPA: TSCPD domain-containing protein [Acetobacteraceae bacterium]|nr:TSCPD domain-containing protein [Acetobacteraceae bacterium]